MDAINPRPGKIDEWPELPRFVFCWLCRDPWVETLYNGMPRPAPYRRKWENVFMKRWHVDSESAFKYAIYMNASELDFAMSGDENTPCWATLCRMLIFSKNNKHLPDGFHLSGVAYMPGATIEGGSVIVPRDQKRAFIGEPKENSGALRVSYVAAPFSEECNPGESQLQGYSIHSRCWDLFAQKVSPQTISRLDLIASCLQKQSLTSLPGYRDLLMGMKEDSTRCFCCRGFCNAGLSHRAQDPLFIPELNKLLHEGIRKARRNKASKKGQATLNILSLRFNIPQEIKYLIAEYLDAQDTSNMLAAFSERFPRGYWKKRISTDTLFEFDSVDPDMIDWEFVAQQVEARGLLYAREVIERRLHMQAIDPIVRFLRGEPSRFLDCN